MKWATILSTQPRLTERQLTRYTLYSPTLSSISNERINALNSKIQALADNKSIFYIEVNSIFDDGSGALTAEYTSDGIHVLAKYYAEWCDWLCQNTVSPAGTSSAETTTESVTYTSEPAVTTKPQNEEFSNH